MKGKGFKEEIRRIAIRDNAESTTDADMANLINKAKSEKVINSVPQTEELEAKSAGIDYAGMIRQAIAQTNEAYQKQMQEMAQEKAKLAEEIESLKEVTTKFKSIAEERAQTAEQMAAKLQEAESKKSTAEQMLEAMTALFSTSGSVMPAALKGVNFNTTGVGDAPTGAIAEAFQIVERSPKYNKRDNTLQIVHDFDRKDLDNFILCNRQAVINSLEKWGRNKFGWFNADPARVQESATTATDLPGGFLQILSSLVRTTASQGFIWAQFATMIYDADARLQQDILIPRYLPIASGDVSDYLLSGLGAYTALTTTVDAVSTSTVPVKVQEYGRGKPAGGGTQYSPIAIPNFVAYYSAYGLIDHLNNSLGRDYRTFENRLIRNEYNKATITVYNNNGEIVTAATDLEAGGGVATKDFLPALGVYMHNAKVQRYPDGHYVIVLPATAIAQLAKSYSDDWKADNVMDLQMLRELFINKEYPSLWDPRVSGYVTSIDGFHVFQEQDTDWATGASGTAGVTTEETLIMRQGWAFGYQAVGRGVSMPMSYRLSTENDYDRLRKVTWISWEGAAAIDVDPDIGGVGVTAGQQRRVFKVKISDAAVAAP